MREKDLNFGARNVSIMKPHINKLKVEAWHWPV